MKVSEANLKGLLQDKSVAGLTVTVDYLIEHGKPEDLERARVRLNIVRLLREALTMPTAFKEIKTADGSSIQLYRRKNGGMVSAGRPYQMWFVIEQRKSHGKASEKLTVKRADMVVGWFDEMIRTKKVHGKATDEDVIVSLMRFIEVLSKLENI